MTKTNFYFNIRNGNIKFDKREKKLRMEVQVEPLADASSLPSRLSQAYLKKFHMNERNASLVQAAYFLIQLFYQTGQRYSCTRTKLGKLLSIVAFYYARKDEQLFHETIYKYDSCGTTFKELNFLIDRDVYNSYEYADDENGIAPDTIDKEAKVPEKYLQTDSLSDDVRSIIRDVFIKFGSYNAVDLGDLLNIIIMQEHVTNATGEINLNTIHKLTYNSFLSIISDGKSDLKLVDYLFKQ